MRDEPRGDELLAALGALAREQAPDPRLEALLEGRLSPKERAELEREAADDPGLSEAVAAFTPLDEAAQARIAERVLALPARSAPPPAQAVGGAKVLAFPPRRLWLAVVPLAAAAALAVFVLRPDPHAALPAYGFTVEGGEKVMRSDEPPSARPRLLPETRLRLVLTPQAKVAEPVAVRAWRIRDAHAEPWAVTARIAPSGAALIEGSAAELGLSALPPGPLTLVVAIGREEALPPPGATASDLAVEGAGYRGFRTEVEILR